MGARHVFGWRLDHSLLAMAGRVVEPSGQLMGMDWRLMAATLSGFIVKENVIATLGVLYGGNAQAGLDATLATAVAPASALAFLVVQMLFIPCVSTVAAMRQETGGWRWPLVGSGLLLAIALAAGVRPPKRTIGWLAMMERGVSDQGGLMRIELTAIGVVRTAATDADVRAETPDIEGELEVFGEFAPALEGIDGYSHLFVVCYFHRLRPDQIGPLQVRPRRLIRRGVRPEDLPLLGVFALDSPTRPNPIGLSLVRVLGREGTGLSVVGLDCFDGTPILDIKGYQPDYRPSEFSVPEWYTRLVDETGHV